MNNIMQINVSFIIFIISCQTLLCLIFQNKFKSCAIVMNLGIAAQISTYCELYLEQFYYFENPKWRCRIPGHAILLK